MRAVYKVGDLISVNTQNTLLWYDKKNNFSPDFSRTKECDKSISVLGIITGIDLGAVYIQVLLSDGVFWISGKSLTTDV
jgi:hypothetical protein